MGLRTFSTDAIHNEFSPNAYSALQNARVYSAFAGNSGYNIIPFNSGNGTSRWYSGGYSPTLNTYSTYYNSALNYYGGYYGTSGWKGKYTFELNNYSTAGGSLGTRSFAPSGSGGVRFGSLTSSGTHLSATVATPPEIVDNSESSFEKSLQFVLARESGYANVAGDRGGATNKGITQKTYNAWLKKNGKGAKDVRNITDAEVRQIYYNEFWKELGCDKLSAKLALFIFDTAVNMGPARAREYLNRYNNGETLNKLIAAREKRYSQIASADPSQQKFLKGWNARMTSLKSEIAVA